MKKRILALILTVAMMVAVLPFSAITASAADTADDGIVGTWWDSVDDGRTYMPNATIYNWASTPGLYAITHGGEGFIMGPHSAVGSVTVNAGQDDAKTLVPKDFTSYKEAIAAGLTAKTTTTTEIIHMFHKDFAYNLPTDFANADLGENPYLAIRMMFKNNSGKIDYNPAGLQIGLGGSDPAANCAYATKIKQASDGSTMLWLDANDGSCTQVRPQSYSNYYSYGQLLLTGDMNGYLLIPISMFGTSAIISDPVEYVKQAGSMLTLKYVNNTTSGTTRNSSWTDKDLYLGDILIVSDPAKFTANYVEKNGISKYHTGYDDSAFIAQRVPGYIGSIYSLQDATNTGGQFWRNNTTDLFYSSPANYSNTSTQSGYMHTVSLPNGDQAFDITINNKLNSAYTVRPNVIFTLDGSNTTGALNGIVKTNLKDSTYYKYGYQTTGLAIRIAATGNADKTIKAIFSLCSSVNSGKYYDTTPAEATTVKYIDANDGSTKDLTLDSTGISLTGNLDGWIVIPNNSKTYFNRVFWDDRGSFAGCFASIGGLADSSQRLYMGDVRFFNDFDKYMGVHSGDTALDIRSASLALEDNIAVNVKINKRKYEDKYGFVAPKATFTYVENTKDAAGTLVGNNYNFKLTGLAVQRAIDALDAVVYSPDGTKSGRTLTTAAGGAYSVKQYCVNQLASTTDAKLKTLLTDLLNYAAEAQKYTGYNKHALANYGIDQSNATAQLAAVDRNKMSHVALDGAAYKWKSASLRLTDTVEIKLNFDGEPAEGMYVKVTDANDNAIWDKYLGVQSGSITFNALNADQMRDVVKFTLYNADGTQASGTLSYSIEAYVAAKASDAEVGALVTAMMKYGDAAAAYRN